MFNFLNYFLFFAFLNKKKNWIKKELDENEIYFKCFIGFFLVKKEDKEFFEYLFPKNFSKIKNKFFLDGVNSESLELIHEKKFVNIEISFFKDFFNYVSNDPDLDFDLIKKENNYEIKIYYKINGDIISTYKIKSDNGELIKKTLKDFEYSEVKIGKYAYKKIKKDLFEKYLSGFDINFENFDIEFEKNDEDNFSIILENRNSFKKIILKKAKINEKTGIISFAGEGENILFF